MAATAVLSVAVLVVLQLLALLSNVAPPAPGLLLLSLLVLWLRWCPAAQWRSVFEDEYADDWEEEDVVATVDREEEECVEDCKDAWLSSDLSRDL